MTEPDWSKAPEDATHWDRLRGNWCNPHGFYHDGKFWEFMHYEWGTERYIPRPEQDKDMTEPDWSKAPEDATHWDSVCGLWCEGEQHFFSPTANGWLPTVNLDWGTDRYIPRPEKEQTMNDFMTPEEEKLTAEDWIEDAPTLSDQAERMYHQPAQVDTKNYDVPNTAPAYDEVNHPRHYQLAPDVEAIDIIRAALTPEQYKGYLLGNLLKYRLRAGNKGEAAKDLAKSDWYKRELNK